MIGAVILAAGQSQRMGDVNKLTKIWNGKPLISHVAEAVNNSKLDRVVCVTGHDAEKIQEILPNSIKTIHNSEYKNGMAGSLRAGIYGLQGVMDVMVILADMPLITKNHINDVINVAENKKNNGIIVVATNDGKLGHPVLFGKRYFVELKSLNGDNGAKTIIEKNKNKVVEVDIGEAATKDLDNPNDFVV